MRRSRSPAIRYPGMLEMRLSSGPPFVLKPGSAQLPLVDVPGDVARCRAELRTGQLGDEHPGGGREVERYRRFLSAVQLDDVNRCPGARIGVEGGAKGRNQTVDLRIGEAGKSDAGPSPVVLGPRNAVTAHAADSALASAAGLNGEARIDRFGRQLQ